jgi:hypothetical protein
MLSVFEKLLHLLPVRGSCRALRCMMLVLLHRRSSSQCIAVAVVFAIASRIECRVQLSCRSENGFTIFHLRFDSMQHCLSNLSRKGIAPHCRTALLHVPLLSRLSRVEVEVGEGSCTRLGLGAGLVGAAAVLGPLA